MAASETDRAKKECYSCYRLIPGDSRFCPYCGADQIQKSGFTLKSSETASGRGQNTQSAPAPRSEAHTETDFDHRTGQILHGRYGYQTEYSPANWTDVAKFAGVIGTVLFLFVLVLELSAAIFGLAFLPQMSSFPYLYPFYFITPFFVGFYIISGALYGIIYTLVVLIIIGFFALLLKNSANFRKELSLKSGGVQASAIFLVATLVMTYYFISIIIVEIMSVFGYTPSSPNFYAAPVYMDYFEFVFPTLWEEIAARVLLIGLPLLIISLITGRGKREWWRYLYGGNIPMGPAATFFLIISSVMFGLGHWLAGSGWGIWKVFPASVAGLMLGYVYLKKGLFASVMMHFSIDAIALITSPINNSFSLSLIVNTSILVWFAAGFIFFVYYLLLAFQFVSGRKLLPEKVLKRYEKIPAATVSSVTPEQRTAQMNAGQIAKVELHPYVPPVASQSPVIRTDGSTEAVKPVLRDTHAYVPVNPKTPVFGYMCSNCGCLEAKYKDGKFVCVYCGHESDK